MGDILVREDGVGELKEFIVVDLPGWRAAAESDTMYERSARMIG
jgi:hypothetical protein